MNEKSNRNYISFVVAVSVGIFIGLQVEDLLTNDSIEKNAKKFNQVLRYTEKYYITDVDSDRLVESAIEGMLNDLDPHTVYIPPLIQQSVEEEFRGNFEGIGIEFQIIDDTINVVTAIPGGPSEAVGIQSGDRIVKIDGADCVAYSNEDVVSSLRGEKGSSVTVTVYRPSLDLIIDYDIIRDEIPIYSLDASFMIRDSIGYLKLIRFSETTFDEVTSALEEMTDQGMTRLIFDLRNNSGGLLSQAYLISDLFLDGDKLIVYTKGRTPEYSEEFFSSKEYPYESIPIVIMINSGSASASEIVAGAVQDWDRGYIVGETSFGKGLVQRPFLLEDNSAIRLTISEYYTPAGRAIQRDYSDRENYYSDVLDESRSEDRIISDSSETDTLISKVKTKGGREIYAGGGIKPDFVVRNEILSDFLVTLRRNNVYYEFARNYIDRNGETILNQYSDITTFENEFALDGREIRRLKDFIIQKDLDFNEIEFENNRDYILGRINAHIARNYWNNQGWYRVLLNFDEQFSKAFDVILDSGEKIELK
jgi:carboxyl-terminal processing protease